MQEAAEQIVPEDQILILDPNEIKVSDELPRQRKDLGEIERMVESIKTFGQLQPVVVNRKMELIAGGRRLAACLLGGFKVRVCFKDAVDPLLMREMELEENIQRKSLTPAEEVLAVAEITELKQKKYGTPVTNSQKGWTQEDTAKLLGKSRTSITEDLLLAEAVKNFPSLMECKTKSDIKKAVKGLETVNRQVEALTKYNEEVKTNHEYSLVNEAAADFLASIRTESMDLLLTDPPFGIDIFDQAIGLGGETGGTNVTTGFKYEDSEEYAKSQLKILAAESARICKPTAHAYVFCAPEYFWWLKTEMEYAGWIVRPKPIIWIKRETGQNNQPSYWPSSAYEFILFARKTASRIVIEGRPDWIQCDPVLPSLRRHQAEKPVPLAKELISRVCMPGDSVIDPFMGSGSTIEAACDLRMFANGTDIGIESYASAVDRMVQWKKKQG